MIDYESVKIKEMIETGLLPDSIFDFLKNKICYSFEKLDAGSKIFDKEKFHKTFQVERFKNLENNFFLYFVFKFEFIKKENIQVVFYYDQNFNCSSISIVKFESKDLFLFNDFKDLPYIKNKAKFEISFRDYEVNAIEVSNILSSKSNPFEFFNLNYQKRFENNYQFSKEKQYWLSLSKRDKSSEISCGLRNYSGDKFNLEKEFKFIKFLEYSLNENFVLEKFNNIAINSKIKEIISKEGYKWDDLKFSLNYIFENIKNEEYEEVFQLYDLMKY
jgi:hypothetical protein